MRQILILAFSLLASGIMAQNKVPNVTVENELGQKIDINTVIEQGKPIVYVFWGAICVSCDSGLEALNSEFDQWRDEFDFQVVAICTEDVRNASKAKSKAKANDWPFTVLYDKNQDFKRAMNVLSVPCFMVANSEGEIVWLRTGYVPGTEDEIYNALKNNKSL